MEVRRMLKHGVEKDTDYMIFQFLLPQVHIMMIVL